MYCPNCGKEIADGSKFCPLCGATIQQPESVQGQPQQTQSTGNGGESKKPIFGLIYWLTIGLALLGMLLGGGILGLLCCIPVMVLSIVNIVRMKKK